MSSYLDTSVNPCEDFYQFSCGNWMSDVDSKSEAVFQPTNVFEVIEDRVKLKMRSIH